MLWPLGIAITASLSVAFVATETGIYVIGLIGYTISTVIWWLAGHARILFWRLKVWAAR
jgi:hypothetical protein